jgi:D-alanyl-D-alanine carboxypeptidase/D-alanyl-D-alanine-endopeptidase (penicillin-binding protein 4)
VNNTNRTLLGLLVLQAFILLGIGLTQGSSNLDVQTRVLVSVEPERVSKLQIQGQGDEAVTLKRSGNDWVLASADDFPAKSDAVEEAVEKLSELRSRNRVLSSSRYHDKLEVSEESFQRKVTVTAGEDEIVFYLGTAPSFKNTHIRLAGEDDVYLVNDFGTSDLAARAWNWVDRSYVEIPESDLWSVAVDNENGSFRLERDPATDAWAALGTAEELDSTEVDEVLRAVRTVNLQEPVSRTISPEFGLDRPVVTATLTVGSSTIAKTPPKTVETRVLEVGAEAEGGRRYVKASDREYVVTVNASSLKPLLKTTLEDLLPEPDETEEEAEPAESEDTAESEGRRAGATGGDEPEATLDEDANTGGAETEGAETGATETGATETGGAGTGGSETGGTETGGAGTGGSETGGTETGGTETGGAETEGAETDGAETAGAETGGTKTEATGPEAGDGEMGPGEKVSAEPESSEVEGATPEARPAGSAALGSESGSGEEDSTGSGEANGSKSGGSATGSGEGDSTSTGQAAGSKSGRAETKASTDTEAAAAKASSGGERSSGEKGPAGSGEGAPKKGAGGESAPGERAPAGASEAGGSRPGGVETGSSTGAEAAARKAGGENNSGEKDTADPQASEENAD